MIRLQQKKAGLELLQASQLTFTQPAALVAVVIMLMMLVSIDGRCSSTAVHCSNTFGNMDNRRSSCSSYAGNTHIPGIRSP